MDAIRKLKQEDVRVFRNARETGRILGVGSFWSVVELVIKGVGKFAGKKIHEVLIVDGESPILVKECKLMSELTHPNITKFCGVCKLPSSTLPVLVMELMDRSLEVVIENDKEDFPCTAAISVFIGVANGLAYLHGQTPPVLHRDLTARNVLLDQDMIAKIADFGSSKIIDAEKDSNAMTRNPGTQVYMPPEALDIHSKYGDRLDIFSFGHLALYALIREFPKNLLPPTYVTSEGLLAARNEVERRSEYVDKLSKTFSQPDHPLYQLTIRCLDNKPTRRPASTELLHWLQEIQRQEKSKLHPADFRNIHTTEEERMSMSLRQMKLDINRHQVEVCYSVKLIL